MKLQTFLWYYIQGDTNSVHYHVQLYVDIALG